MRRYVTCGPTVKQDLLNKLEDKLIDKFEDNIQAEFGKYGLDNADLTNGERAQMMSELDKARKSYLMHLANCVQSNCF